MWEMEKKYFSSTQSDCSKRELPFVKDTKKRIKGHIEKNRLHGRLFKPASSPHCGFL